MLNYYNIITDTEYVLSDNERIDLVVYSKDRKGPDIGTEVEITSKLQHDFSKLLRVKSLQLRL
jgi:hypothetical protein